MLKFFYRLRRRGGVVLFAVIAIMTLLIAMATTAYFTARSSYNTVVSNYDFSQTYLSAISISDMVIEAITQDTFMPGADNGDGTTTLNYFAGLKSKVQDLKDTIPGSDDAKIVGYSHNLSGHTANESDILEAAANAPVASGIFDGVKIEIAHVGTNYKDSQNLDVAKFTVTTTVYYRGTTITVQDTILNHSGEKSKEKNLFDRFFTASGDTEEGHSVGNSRLVLIDTHDISDDAYFQNDYTIFALNETAQQNFHGSLMSSGSVYIYQFNTTNMMTENVPASIPNDGVEGNKNDWFIKGDLVFGGNAGGNFSLNGGNLYVEGDLILGGSGVNFSAGNIYVKGNIYYLQGGSGSMTGNLHVGSGETSILDDATAANAKIAQVNALLTANGISKTLGNFSNGNKSVFSHGTVSSFNSTDLITISTKDRVGTTYKEIVKNKFKQETEGGTATYTPVDVKGAMEAQAGLTDYDNYTAKDVTLQNTLDIDIKAGDSLPQTWEIKSASDIIDNFGGAYVQNLTPDWEGAGLEGTATQTVNADGSIRYTVSAVKHTVVRHEWEAGGKLIEDEAVNYVYDIKTQSDGTLYDSQTDGVSDVMAFSDGSFGFKATKGTEYAKVKKNGDGSYNVDIPYYADGYLLGIYNPPNAKIKYNFDTNGQTMPVVLKANYKDSSGLPTDSKGYNAFLWSTNLGANPGSNCGTQVRVKGGGNLLLEVGNYKENETTHEMEYVEYEPQSGINVPTYYMCQRLMVGTEKQIDDLGGDDGIDTASKYEAYYSSKPYAKPDYDNHVILISNKNNGVAFNGDPEKSIMFGYLYAPNGVFKGNHNSMSIPVFGGMIVSVYDSKQDQYFYVAPNTDLIDALAEKMKIKQNNPSTTTVEGYWETQFGKNYIG